MILPNQYQLSLFYAAVPIWRWEEVPQPPAPQEAPGSSPAADTDTPVTEGAGSAAAEAPGLACTPQTPVQRRQVFAGYEWRPSLLWETMANTSWDSRADEKRDESSAKARRAAAGLQALPAAALPEASGPPASGSPAQP